MTRWIAIALLCAVSTASADSARALRPLTRTARAHSNATTVPDARHRIATTARTDELPAARRAIDPEVARAVLAPRLTDHASVVEQTSTWIEPAKPREKKPWRPRILPLPMSSPTGGGGVKVKIRF